MVKKHGNNSVHIRFENKEDSMRLRPLIFIVLLSFCAGTRPAAGLTTPLARDLCRINGIVKEIRETAQPVPWHGEKAQTVTEIAVEIRKAELLEKRTQQDSSRCIMYEYGQMEWFKLCDQVRLEAGLRIRASEGTTIGPGRYCIYDIDILDP